MTRKNGRPTLSKSAGVNCGATHSGVTNASGTAALATSPDAAAISAPITSAATTAKRGHSALHSSRGEHPAAQRQMIL